MKKLQSIVVDDPDDTLLFKRLEAHILGNCPNPQRIGCPDHDTLRTFVETPRKVGLGELHELHIFKCAECTRELIELRRLREERLRREAFRFRWTSAAVAVPVCAAVLISLIIWKNHAAKPMQAVEEQGIASVTLDLRDVDSTRGLESEPALRPISLPRKVVDLHVILPYYSPAGDYQVIVAMARDAMALQSVRTHAVAQGPRTELRVRLDLRQLSPGRYYLGTAFDGESTKYFYAFTLG